MAAVVTARPPALSLSASRSRKSLPTLAIMSFPVSDEAHDGQSTPVAAAVLDRKNVFTIASAIPVTTSSRMSGLSARPAIASTLSRACATIHGVAEIVPDTGSGDSRSQRSTAPTLSESSTSRRLNSSTTTGVMKARMPRQRRERTGRRL
jgi:hypothetical protein